MNRSIADTLRHALRASEIGDSNKVSFVAVRSRRFSKDGAYIFGATLLRLSDIRRA